MMLMVKKVSWWLWLASSILLSMGIIGYEIGFLAAVVLSVFQIIYFVRREKSITAFPVQIRVGYLLILLIALWPPLNWVFWIPTIGTWVVVLTGYCFLARCLSLLPFNRKQPISSLLLRKTFFSRPVNGNILQGLSD